ncbi:hypothetical protein BY458DRAFT_588207 [Sporodiniella umbellata]|nr:hypothetical protein BY458DRAFT_588207 [Sporodiniella umbellata]
MLASKENELVTRICSAQFNSTTEAVNYCRQVCSEHGYTIQCEPLTNNTMYLSCFPEQSSKKRHISSHANYKFLLSHKHTWFFQNICPSTNWPQKFQDRIDQLVDQNQSEISKTIQSEFPESLCDDRQLTDYLNKRRQQKETVERARKLITTSTRLCSLAAANEDWTTRVESDLDKMLKKYSKVLKIPNELLDFMVDIQLEKKNAHEQKSMEVDESRMAVPGCTLFVRSQHQRTHVPERADVTFPINPNLMEYFRDDIQQQPQMMMPPSPYTPVYTNFYQESSFPLQTMHRPNYTGYNSRMVMQPPRHVQSQQPDQPWP